MADTVPTAPPLLQKKPITFGPYKLLRKLGSGGMAETHLAERSGPGDFRRKVCLKLILSERAADKEFISWFFDEARIHAELHHGNIVQVYEFGEHEGRNYLALEFVDGCDLRTLMHRLEDAQLRLPHPLAVLIAYEMAAALDCAHKLQIGGVHQGLVHRDLSPANILLSHQGHSKLSDFGVVKATSRITRTDTGITKGKVPYMSPEQIMGGAIDGRTDLFALGVILFELMSGRHPYRQRSDDLDIVIAKRIVEKERPTLKEVAPHVPDALCVIVEQLLELELGARISSAKALLDLLTPLAPGAAASRELGDFVEAVRSSRAFPCTAVEVVGVDGKGTAVDPQARRARGTVTRTAIVSRADAPPVDVDTFRPLSFKKWGRVVLVAGAVAIAAALALQGEPRAEGGAVRAEAPPEVRAVARPARIPREPTAPAVPRNTPRPAIEALAPGAIVSPAPSSVVSPAPSSVESPTPSSVESPAPAGAERTPGGQATTTETERAASSAHTGSAILRVILLPFGRVEVDGKRGSSPLVLRLAPGSHTIRAGRSATLSHRETVRLKAGEERDVLIDLTNEP